MESSNVGEESLVEMDGSTMEEDVATERFGEGCLGMNAAFLCWYGWYECLLAATEEGLEQNISCEELQGPMLNDGSSVGKSTFIMLQ